jgi:hypothetical protein
MMDFPISDDSRVVVGLKQLLATQYPLTESDVMNQTNITAQFLLRLNYLKLLFKVLPTFSGLQE